MFLRTLKLAWFKRDRYLLTIIAIGLSVGFIVSTLLLTTSIADVGEPIGQGYSKVDTAVTGPAVTEADGPQAAVLALVPPTVVSDLQAAGFEAVGFSAPYAQVIDADGNPSGQAQASSNVAEPWLGTSDLNAFSIIEGSPPANIGEAAIDQTTADGAGLEVGDEFAYVTDAGLQDGLLVGVATFGGASNDPYFSTLLMVDTDPIFDVGQGYKHVLVAGAATEVDVTSAVAQTLDSREDLVVTTGSAWVATQIENLESFLGFFQTFLTVFAVIAVIVGMVIVTNTFTVSLAQRTQELALLRLVGTTHRQLMSQVVIEALLLGFAGTVLGVVVGLIGENVMGWFVDLLGLSIERSNAISPAAILIGVAVGMGVTVAAAVLPARKATRVAPIEALRAAEIEPPSAGKRRSVAAATATAVGVLGLGYGMTQGDIIVTGVAIGSCFIALYLGGEFLIRAAARIARPLLSKGGPTGTLASRNLERNAGRTAAASSALMIGISLIAFFTLMAATIGQFIAGDAADSLTADYVVRSVGTQPEPVLGDEVINSLRAVEGVDVVVAVQLTSVTPATPALVERVGPGEGSLAVAATNVVDLQTVFDFEVLTGSLENVRGRSVIIDEATAESQDLSSGDSLAVTTQAGPVDLDVVAVVSSSMPGAPSPGIVGSPELAAILGYDRPATVAYVAADVGESALTDAMDLATLDVQTKDEYIDGLSANFDTILALVYALLAVAVVIALVGIANTVSLAISERVGEIAAVRAAGASARQIFWSLISEFGLLALVGVLSGLALAWVSATGFFRAISGGQIGFPSTDVVTALIIIGLGLAGGILAAWLPARSASRANPLDVLRAE